jgi:tetratricopeptide (TPR) repeat protein
MRAEAPDETPAVNDGNQHLASGDYEAALEAFESAPDDLKALSGKAKALEGLGRTTEALAVYDAIFERDPSHPEPLADKAALLTAMSDYDQAVALYDRALRIAPDRPAYHRDRALALRLSERLEASLEEFDHALRLDPDDANTLAAKADLLIEMEQFADAIDCLDRAAAIADGSVQVADWTSRGQTLLRLYQLDKAAYCFKRALEIAPDDQVALSGMGRVLQARDDQEGALRYFEQATSHYPDRKTTWNEHGDTLIALERFKEALESYERALHLDDTDKRSLFGKAYCLEQLDKPEQALNVYEAIEQLDPEDASAWEGRGRCWTTLNRNEKAVAAFRRALQLDPQLEWGEHNLAYVLSVRLSEYKNAIEHYNRSIARLPCEAAPIDGKAHALACLGHYDEARKVLDEALESGVVTDRGTILISLSSLHYRMFKLEEALGYLEQAEALGPLHDGAVLSKAELLILLDRHADARRCLATVREKDLHPGNQSVAAYLLLVSLALRGDREQIPKHFEEFLQLTSAAGDLERKKPAVEDWYYEAMIRKVSESDISLRLRFMLLVSIDLQLGRLSAPSLEKFPLPLFLAAPQRPPRWPEPDDGKMKE